MDPISDIKKTQDYKKSTVSQWFHYQMSHLRKLSDVLTSLTAGMSRSHTLKMLL